jgi:tyrosyl-tRNA synthetase
MSDARRKVQQGGVRINGQKVSASGGVDAEAAARGGEEYLLQAGKHAAVRVRKK